MKVIDFLKEYFNSANKIVFWLTGLSIAWIIGYKFFWIDINPLFSNADKIADIIYTICTSVVASGLFYLFTIFIPKYFKIKKMRLELKKTTDSIDELSKKIIKNITKGNSDEKYCLSDYIYTIKNNEKEAKAHFIFCFHKSNNNNLITRVLSYQINEFEYIYYIYNQLLSDRTKRDLVSIFKQQQKNLQISSDIPDDDYCLYELYYNIFKEIILLNDNIK